MEARRGEVAAWRSGLRALVVWGETDRGIKNQEKALSHSASNVTLACVDGRVASCRKRGWSVLLDHRLCVRPIEGRLFCPGTFLCGCNN